MEYIKTKIIERFKGYLSWETNFSFDGWENIELYIADTLSEAWIQARPNDIFLFSDKHFEDMVNSANGKWLEKRKPDDTYNIILSTKYNKDIDALAKTYVHELRHCLDYQNAVKELSFEEYRVGSNFYIDWSEYRAVMADTRYEFYIRIKEFKDCTDYQIFCVLSEILGVRSADSVAGLMNSRKDIHDIRYFISRYVGASRAIRNLNIELNEISSVFHLWTMTPRYINEIFDKTFYLGNEWDDIEECNLDAEPKYSYYNDFLETISK